MIDADDARRARQRVNSAAYRARQKAAAATKVKHGAQPHGGGVVAKAAADAQAMRVERDRILRLLPHAMSAADRSVPVEKVPHLRPVIDLGRDDGPTVKTKRAQANRAAAIRQNANAERLQGIGRQRKAALKIELTDGPISEELQEMSASDRARFRQLTDRIAAGSAQSIGILFKHAGGQSLYSAAIEKIRYKPSRDAGFGILEALADYAERAAELYSPAALKRQGLGDRNGRLNI